MKKNSYSCIIFLIIVLGSIPSNSNVKIIEEIENEVIANPIAQDYSPSLSGDYNNVNVTLHQATENTTLFEVNQTNTSFSRPAPQGFTTSKTNITFDNIQAYDIQNDIEDSSPLSVVPIGLAPTYVINFNTTGDCYLDDASFYISKSGTDMGDLYLHIYGGEWNSLLGRYVPKESALTSSDYSITLNAAAGTYWADFTNLNQELLSSNTVNNVWFIGIRMAYNDSFAVGWRYCADSGGSEDTEGDEADSFKLDVPRILFVPEFESYTVDFLTKVTLDLGGVTAPDPESIGLTINGTAVNNNTSSPSHNSGYWDTIGEYCSSSNIEFIVSSDWGNYSADINFTSVNYTQSFKAPTSYLVDHGNDVTWTSTSTFSSLSADSDLSYETINFTIPISWTATSLDKSGAVLWNTPIWSNSTSQIITVDGASAVNGEWTLTCSSTNFISDIKIGIGGVELSEPYFAYSDSTLELNSTFIENLNGIVNLTIYHPSDVNDEMVYTTNPVISVGSSTSVNTFDDWDISAGSLAGYGDFRVQLVWSNETDVSVYDTSVFIAGVSQYSTSSPHANGSIVHTNDIPFNISVSYEDITNSPVHIAGATIGFSDISGWVENTAQNNADNTYNVTIDPSTYPAGDHVLTIMINNSKYMNHTFTYELTVEYPTQVQDITSNDFNAIRGINATYEMQYYNISQPTEGISNAFISVNEIDSFEWSYVESANGHYTIELNTSVPIVNEYLFNFSISASNYQPQDFIFNITTTPASTAISLVSLNNTVISRPSNKNLSIIINVDDISISSGLNDVPNSALYVYEGTSNTNWTTDETSAYRLWSLGNGAYLVNVSLGSSGISRINVGEYLLRINLTYSPNYLTSILFVGFNISGNATSIGSLGLSEPTLTGSGNDFSIFQQDRSVAVNFQYIDLDSGSLNIPAIQFDDFTYFVYINGVPNSIASATFSYVQIRTRNEGTLDFTGYSSGEYNITIDVSFDNYQNASTSFNITVLDLETIATYTSITQTDHTANQLHQETGQYVVYAHYDLQIEGSYLATLTASGVADASLRNLEWDGSDNYTMTNHGDGTYLYTVPSSWLTIGIHTITLYYGLIDFENATSITITLDVRNLTTSVVFDHISQPERNDDLLIFQSPELGFTTYTHYDVLVNVTYFDTNNSVFVPSGATGTLYIDSVFYSNTPSFNANDQYTWVIDNLDLPLGTSNISITFFLSDYNPVTYSFNITITNIPTSADLNDEITQPDRNGNTCDYFDLLDPAKGYIVYNNYYLLINITYFDALDGINIIDAHTANLTFNGQNFFRTSTQNGIYSWNISKILLLKNTYNLTFQFNATDYDYFEYSFNITVNELSTDIQVELVQQIPRSSNNISPTSGSYDVYMHYEMNINVSYYDFGNLQYIDDPSMVFIEFLNTNYSIYWFNPSAHTFGFKLSVSNLTSIGLGVHPIEFHFGHDILTNASVSTNLNIILLETYGDFDEDIYQPTRNSFPLALINPNAGYRVFMQYGLHINASYYNDADNVYIAGATSNIYLNGTQFSSNYFANNLYGWFIPSANLSSFGLGWINVTIQFSLNEYETATIQFNMTLFYLETTFDFISISQPSHHSQGLDYNGETMGYTVYMPYDLVIAYEYLDSTNNLRISNAELTNLTFDGENYLSPLIENGVYSWTINAANFEVGTYNISILIGLKNYVNQSVSFNITLTILPTKSDFYGISQPEQETGLISINSENSYVVFSPFGIQFNITYIDGVTDNFLSGAIATCYYNGELIALNSSNSGNYGWFISSSELVIGTGPITIQLSLSSCQTVSYSFNITVIGEYAVLIEKIYMPDTLVQGESYDIIFKLSYTNGSTSYPIIDGDVRLLTNKTEISVLVGVTNATGHVVFTFIAPQGDYQNLVLTIEYGGELYGVSDQASAFSAKIVSPTILPSWFLPALLILVGSVSLAIVVQKKVIAPRKMHYTDLVMSSSTIFDDAINLHHIMIIHKATGVSLFFKSFAEEELDPDLISGFLSAVQSFGKEIKSQKSLNELSYGDKILLFSDGVFIRVTLVLGKSASPYMKRNLAKFVGRFEADYHTKLEKWRGQLNTFADAGDLIDDILNTSVILPHQYNADSKLLKGISRALTKQILEISKTLITEERNFMFLAQLLSVAIDQTKKQPGEIILSITELLDAKILTPIKLDVLEEQALTDQELRTLRERVWAIPNKSEDEKQQILTDVTQLSEAERDVAIQSLSQTLTITSETTGEVIKSKIFETEGDARKEIKELNKLAKKALKSHEFDEAIRNYEIAEVIAYQWNMENLGKTYGNLVLSNTVTKYKTTLKQKTKEGQKFMKAKEFQSAFNAFKLALEAAHSLFKMGYIEVEDNIKDLVKRSGEALKYCEDSVCDKEYYTKETLIEYRKFLLKELKTATKAKDLFMQTELNTKLLLISNILFKFGIGAENSNIKKYHSDIDNLLKKMNELDGEMKTAMDGVRAGFIQSKEILMEEAISFEKVEDWINALITYQKILDIYCKIGDADNALNLRTKIDILIQKIPDLHDSITYFSQECDRHRNESKDANMAEICLDNANLLKDAIFYRD
ncbi:hypothetical protein [Candidatus Lokiarchaeum ossiferum]